MPLPYSTDLRERVLVAHEHGEGTAAALARRFRVALNTVKNWVRAAEREGRRVAKPLGHGPEPRLGAAEREVLRQLVAADNDATLAEYGARLAAQTGVRVSRPVLCVTPQALGLDAQKKTLRASEQERADIAADWPVFQAFLQQVLIPTLGRSKPGATIVIDHLAAHRTPQARALLESAGFALLPLPRYSPDLSPIEPCWSKLKTSLRTAEPRSIAPIEEQIGPALDTITSTDAKGWFRHCGYALSN